MCLKDVRELSELDEEVVSFPFNMVRFDLERWYYLESSITNIVLPTMPGTSDHEVLQVTLRQWSTPMNAEIGHGIVGTADTKQSDLLAVSLYLDAVSVWNFLDACDLNLSARFDFSSRIRALR